MRSWPQGPSHHVHRLKRLHRFLKNSGVKEARVFEPLAAIIWSYRPFRIGDRIEIQGAGTCGDVVDIGLRTTRIRTGRGLHADYEKWLEEVCSRLHLAPHAPVSQYQHNRTARQVPRESR